MRYVDGFLIPLPRRKLPAYLKMARLGRKIWLEHGAVDYRECVGDDFTMKGIYPFPKAIRARRGEVVVFSWIGYRSRAHRDRVNAKVMKDPRIARMMIKDMPFDPKRMAAAGFRVIV